MKIHKGRSSGNYLTNLASASVSLNPTSFEYDGNPKTPTVMVTLGGIVLQPNRDYSVVYSDNMSAGTAVARVDGIGTYEGSVEKSFLITAPEEPSTSLTRAVVTLPYTETTYTGSALTPTPTVKLNGTTLTAGTHYSISYQSNVARGTATVVVTGISPYSGTASATFKILPPDVSSATVTLNAYVFNYTGSLVRPVPTVSISVGGTTVSLVKDTDYTVSYEYTGIRGTAYVVIYGTGGYTGVKKTAFQIGKDMSSAEVDIGVTEYPYTGGAVRPWPKVTMAGRQLVDGVDYDVTYEDNVEVGVGRIVVTGKNDYAGSVTKLMSVSNTENLAWKNLVFSNAVTRQTGVCFVPFSVFGPDSYGNSADTSGDYQSDSRLHSMQPLPDGSLYLFLNVCRSYFWSLNNPRSAKLRFQSGHEFDLSGDENLNPLYLKRNGANEIDAELMTMNRDIAYGSRTRTSEYVMYFNYGRGLFLPGPMYTSYEGNNDGYSGSGGVVRIPGGFNTSRKSLIMADLSSPYSLDTKGCERLAYQSTLGGTDGFVSARAFFSNDGTKFFFSDAGTGSEYGKFRVFTLKTPWVLDGSSSVQSEETVDVNSFHSGDQTPRFSPDGKYFVTVENTWPGLKLYKYRMDSPWDLANATVESSTTNKLTDENGGDIYMNYMANGWFIVPERHVFTAAQYAYINQRPGILFRSYTI